MTIAGSREEGTGTYCSLGSPQVSSTYLAVDRLLLCSDRTPLHICCATERHSRINIGTKCLHCRTRYRWEYFRVQACISDRHPGLSALTSAIAHRKTLHADGSPDPSDLCSRALFAFNTNWLSIWRRTQKRRALERRTPLTLPCDRHEPSECHRRDAEAKSPDDPSSSLKKWRSSPA